MGRKIYRWRKYKNGISCFAFIILNISINDVSNVIVENCSGNGFLNQGYIEEVSKCGYDSWKMVVKQGLKYAFSLSENFWSVHIDKFEGLTTDTNFTVAGYTAIRAF